MPLSDTLKAMMERDVQAVARDMPSVLQWDGKTVNGTASPAMTADQADPAGMIDTADLEFVALVQDFGASLPEIRDVVLVDGIRYWVAQINSDGAIASLALRRG